MLAIEAVVVVSIALRYIEFGYITLVFLLSSFLLIEKAFLEVAREL
jgi:hypothetical protein